MAALKRLIGLKPVDPRWYAKQTHLRCEQARQEPIRLTYLGTAGFVIESEHRAVVLDPYLSRPSLWQTFSSPLVSNLELVRQTLPRADDVLIGHAHYDHILDAPALCQHTGARLIGSASAIMVGRAAGLPEHQLRATQGREDIPCGAWSVRGLPSVHGRLLGRIPFPGDIEAPPSWPPRVQALRHGLVLNWIVKTMGLTVGHIDSADFINEELQGHTCDVLCLCAIGRRARPNYVRDAVRLLRPKWVVPCHWDTMITPLHAQADMIPGVDLPGLIREIEACGVVPLLTPMLGSLQFAG